MNILIYFTANQRAVDQQSVMEMLQQQGHNVMLLTLLPKGELHANVEKFGVKTYSFNMHHFSGLGNYYKQYKLLKAFIKQHSIDRVITHLQPAGFPAGLVSLSSKAKFIYVRHNMSEERDNSRIKAFVVNGTINKCYKQQIAPSDAVKNYLMKEEGVSEKKIHRINYGYNFNQYLQTDYTNGEEHIRNTYNGDLLIVSVARLVSSKNYPTMINIVEKLVKDYKRNIKYVVLSDGMEFETLTGLVKQKGLENHIFFLGRKTNVFDYLYAADIVMHLSFTEASNSAVKEAGYCKCVSIVGKGVGDFDSYINHGSNGFIVNLENAFEETTTILEGICKGDIALKPIQEAIYETINTTFNINNIKNQYIKLLEHAK
jgi:glycosyltransferase involved in cell wall biosynthesis